MNSRKFTTFAGIALALLLVLGISSNIAAQGRGGGGGNRGGGGSGNSGGMGGGRSNGGGGVDRGINTSSERSNGRADNGRDNASERSNGRSDGGIDRARENETRRRENMPKDNELNRYQGIARKLNTTPEALRSQFQTAQIANPDLKFGQFVAANMVANNLGSRFPNVTTAAILSGLQNGDSLGQTLRNLGVGGDESGDIERSTKREMKKSKKQHSGDDDDNR